MDKINGMSLDLEKQNIDKIKELFPEAVEEGKINFDMLKEMLGDEIDESKEKYQFTWNGKSKTIKLAQTPSSATLRPCKEKSKNWDTTENLYIEGDNLEVLKQLQKTYYGKIKMIYIDPPYNTGNDFVYNDSFSDSIENYKEQTRQIYSSNPETNGRFHTDWLNMMYPRLILAKNLLSDEGVIFISIDDNELDNLKKICDEIYGEANFVSNIIWQSTAGSNTGTDIVSVTENILVYTKNRTKFKFDGMIASDKSYIFSDIYENERGKYALDKLDRRRVGSHYSESLNYPIKMPDGTLRYPGGTTYKNNEGWNYLWSKDKVDWGIKNEFVEIKKVNGIWSVYNKRYANMDNEGNFIERTIPFRNLITSDSSNTAQGTAELRQLFGMRPFDFPKPSKLIYTLLSQVIRKDNNAIVTDFFSGSATTAHAVMKLNAEDGGNRKFIMVQLPELTDKQSEAYKAGYKNICEIGEERIRRAGEQIKAEWEKEHNSDGLFVNDEKFNTDIGFKIFKLDSTNIVPWDNTSEFSEDNLWNVADVFKHDRSKEDILYEIMLKYGVFDKQVEEIEVNNKTMYRIGRRHTIVCLEDKITSEDVKAIAELSPKNVIFKESGFVDDNAKINAVYNLKKADVEDIKCI